MTWDVKASMSQDVKQCFSVSVAKNTCNRWPTPMTLKVQYQGAMPGKSGPPFKKKRSFKYSTMDEDKMLILTVK